MTEREELLKEIAELKAKRDTLLAQVKEAEMWEVAAWDSFNALSDHINSLEKKRKIAGNYWDASEREVRYTFEFVIDEANKVLKMLALGRTDLLEEGVRELINRVREAADTLGVELDELPLDFSFFDLPPKKTE